MRAPSRQSAMRVWRGQEPGWGGGKPLRQAAGHPRDRTRGPGGGRHRRLAKATLASRQGRARQEAGATARVPQQQHRPLNRRDGYPICFGTEGRSEGRRLGYLCLQQQHVEVGDGLSVDAQELQFTSQGVCQLADLELPGERGQLRAAFQWHHHPGGLGCATLSAGAHHPLLYVPRTGWD